MCIYIQTSLKSKQCSIEKEKTVPRDQNNMVLMKTKASPQIKLKGGNEEEALVLSEKIRFW